MADEVVRDRITISVRSLVEFILRSGDIDNSGAGPVGTEVMLKGSRLHRKLQGMRGPGYIAEMPLKISVSYDAELSSRICELSEDEDDWKNVDFARYYGIKGVRMTREMRKP